MKSGLYRGAKANNHQRRRRLNFTGFIKSLLRIGLVILIFNLGWLFISNLTKHPTIAKWGTIEKGLWVEALCLRDETVVLAPCNGNFRLEAIPGSRLPYGQLIGWITNENNQDEIGIPDQPKSKLQKEAEKLYTQDYLLRQRLEKLTRKNEILELLLNNTPSESRLAQKTRQDLNILKKEKGRILRNIQECQFKIARVQGQFQRIAGVRAVLTASTPGYFFNQFDNWEARLTPEAYQSLAPDDLRRNYGLRSVNGNVKAGAIIGKIVSPFNQRIVIEINSGVVKGDLTKNQWWLKLNDNLTPINFLAALPLDNGHKLLFFDDPLFAVNLMPQRRSRVYLVYRRVSGVMVPFRSLYYRGQTTEVKVMKGDAFERKPVRVIETDGYQAVIEGIEFGTTILTR